MPPVAYRDRVTVWHAGSLVEEIYNDLHDQAPGPGLVLDKTRRLLDDARSITRGTAWSRVADTEVRTELAALPAVPGAQSPSAVHHDLQRQIDELRHELADDQKSVPNELLLSAIRIGVGITIGAVVAGPLAATVPVDWIPWVSEPLKAAIGGGVGALAAEVTKPLERHIALEAQEPKTPATAAWLEPGTQGVDRVHRAEQESLGMRIPRVSAEKSRERNESTPFEDIDLVAKQEQSLDIEIDDEL